MASAAPAPPAAALCNCLGFGSKNSAIVLGAVPMTECRDGCIVVGAGSGGRDCGASCSLAPACRVRLLDRATFPRDKLCGDSLNPGAIGAARTPRSGGAVEARGAAD